MLKSEKREKIKKNNSKMKVSGKSVFILQNTKHFIGYSKKGKKKMSKPKLHYRAFTITNPVLHTGKWQNICKQDAANSVNLTEDLHLVTCGNCKKVVEQVLPSMLEK